MHLDLNENIQHACADLLNIEKSYKNLDILDLSDYKKDNTALVFVDIIEGFVNTGMLSSSRAVNILPYIKVLNEKSKGFHKIYFSDTHAENSTEFMAYPPHCIKNSVEPNLVKELIFDKHDRKSIYIEKNSTNGFHTEKFQTWLKDNKDINTFIICGLVTDICVMQFALTLKSYFNEINKPVDIIVPIEAVETFSLDATLHKAELMNIFALYNMNMNGIKILSMEKLYE